MAKLSGNLVAIRSSIWKKYGKSMQVGWLGDAAHRNRKSDHNPDGRGIVCAIDPMVRVGPRAAAIAKAARGRKDLSYVIYNRTIWSAAYGWRARRYTGSDPHTGHVHISSKHTSSANNYRVGLNLGGSTATAAKPAASSNTFPGLLQQGSKGANVKKLQTKLKLKADGDFGPATKKAVIAYQKAHKLTADGKVGPKTWNLLF